MPQQEIKRPPLTMLLIPTYKKIDWKTPPIVTIALVLMNVFIYFAFQLNEEAQQQVAVEYYFDSPLPKIEFPAYINYLSEKGNIKQANQARQAFDEEPEAWGWLLMTIETDAKFMQHLSQDQIIKPENEFYPEWKSARVRFNELLNNTVSAQYGFTPAKHKPVTLIAHMFLHGGVGHLVGNMIFLFAIGFAVEMVVGRRAFLAVYLLGGLAAVGLFWALYPDSNVPLVGASGAIAGLMGIYTVLFWTRRIDFFYFILFYFNFTRAPAIILLPLWLANEFYQLFMGGDSQVAYAAHIGGLVGGAAVGVIAKAVLPSINTDYMDVVAKDEQRRASLETGMRMMAALQLDKAKKIFQNLLQQDSGDRTVLTQLYNIAKFKPDSDDYHRYAARMLSLPGDDTETLKIIHEKFHDYIKTAKPSVRFQYNDYLALASRFMLGGYLDDAEKMINMVLKANRENKALPAALLKLAQNFIKRQDHKRSMQYLQVLVAHSPQSTEAAEASRLMAWAKTLPRPPAGDPSSPNTG